MKPAFPIAVLLAATSMLPLTAGAAPVAVTQTVTLQEIGPFGSGFATATFGANGWSALFPFTQASQIQSITWTFSTDVPLFNDSTLWPTTSGGGVPGVELGVEGESVPGRTALVSFVPGNLTFAMVPGTEYDLVQGLVIDGAIQASLGAFFNFPNGNPAFSDGTTLTGTSRLTLTLTGDVPNGNPVPEPMPFALLGLATVAAMGAARRRVWSDRPGTEGGDGRAPRSGSPAASPHVR